MRYVVAVAEERNFTRAAERCFVVQSALSHQIKALERELGVTLFARTNRRVDVTAAGEAFLAAARISLEAAERAASDAAAATGEIRGTLTIGMIPTVTAVDMPAVLAAFHRSHPSVRIRLRGGGSDEFTAAINSSQMDVAVLGLPDSVVPQGVQTRVLARERLVAVVSAGHHLAHRKRLQLSDLADESFVDFPEGSPAEFPRTLRSARPEYAVTSRSKLSPRNSCWLLFATTSSSHYCHRRQFLEDDQLRTIPLTDGPTRIEYLAWSSFNPSPAAQAFVGGISV